MQRGATDLAHAFGDRIGGGEDLGRLLVKEQMVGAKMRAAHVPMEVLGLDVERKGVGQQGIERGGNLAHGCLAKVGGGVEGSGDLVARIKGPDFAHEENSERLNWPKAQLAKGGAGSRGGRRSAAARRRAPQEATHKAAGAFRCHGRAGSIRIRYIMETL